MKPERDRERCRAVYELIIAYTEEQGYPPSVREITDACGISSLSVTQHYLGLLQDWGYIRRVPYRARGIQIVALWRDDAIDQATSAGDGDHPAQGEEQGDGRRNVAA